MKKQEQVFLELLSRNRERSIREVSRGTGLKTWQVHNAVKHLINRGLVKKQVMRNQFVGYCQPPKMIYVQIDRNSSYKKWRANKLADKIIKELG